MRLRNDFELNMGTRRLSHKLSFSGVISRYYCVVVIAYMLTGAGELVSILYVVATPIGNLGDLSKRAAEILAGVDIVAAEDTRRTGQLLSRLGIQAKLIPLHDHNEVESTERLLKLLDQGKEVAVVSDAGTPLISDPGYQLVRACRARGIAVVPVPGPSSVTAALSVAGLPTHRFTFEGFVPAKQKARREFFEGLKHEARTMVLFEAPHRIVDCLGAIQAVMGGSRNISLCRELTKTFEQVTTGTVDELVAELASGSVPAKGEFVIVLSGSDQTTNVDADALLIALGSELSPSKAAAIAARLTNLSKAQLYDRALVLKNSS